MANYIVTTSLGEAILRLPRPNVDGRFDPRMIAEAAALNYARDHGVRAPRLLYAEDDAFLIEEFISGDEPSIGSWPSWLPNLVNEVKALQAGPPPTHAGLRSVYDWQLWMTSTLERTYTGIPPTHQARMSELRIPPLHEFWQANEMHDDRSLTLVHSDLHPRNLLLNHRGLWILDWELALIADPIWEAAVALHRTPWPTPEAREQATELWLTMLTSLGHDADILHTLLAEYNTVEVWRSLINDSRRYPQMIVTNPGCTMALTISFHDKLAAGARAFGCADLNHDETYNLLQKWGHEQESGTFG